MYLAIWSVVKGAGVGSCDEGCGWRKGVRTGLVEESTVSLERSEAERRGFGLDLLDGWLKQLGFRDWSASCGVASAVPAGTAEGCPSARLVGALLWAGGALSPAAIGVIFMAV